MMERAITLSDGASIDLQQLNSSLLRQTTIPELDLTPISNTVSIAPTSQQNLEFPHEGLEQYLEKVEKDMLLNALNSTHWNRTLAAKKLGMSFRSLRYRLKKFGLDTDDG